MLRLIKWVFLGILIMLKLIAFLYWVCRDEEPAADELREVDEPGQDNGMPTARFCADSATVYEMYGSHLQANSPQSRTYYPIWLLSFLTQHRRHEQFFLYFHPEKKVYKEKKFWKWLV